MRSGEPYPPLSAVARSAIAAMLACAAALAAVTCGGSTSTSIVGPDTVKCQTAVTAQTGTVPADGGSITISVNAARECTWTASSEAAWIQISPTSGQGEGSLTATVAPNEQPSPRSAAISVNDQRVSLMQEARPCRFDLGVTTIRMSHQGGRGSINVETLTGCAWRASTSASWVRLLTSSGNGTGALELEVPPNGGADREALVAVADQSFTIVQSGPPSDVPGPAPAPAPPNPGNCLPTVTPATLEVPAAGGQVTVTIDVGASCDWSASTSSAWITFASSSSGHGGATLRLTITANTAATARTGTITVLQQTVTVVQAGAPPAPTCTFTVSPASSSVPASGGERQVQVTTTSGCEWTASSGASWVVLATTRGTGSRDVRYTVQANTATSSRSATLTIAGSRHTVTQSGAAPTCTFSLDPAAQSFGPNGGEGVVRVTTQQGCEWTASSGASWVVSSSRGTGSDDARYTVQPNTGSSSRSTTISIGGQTHAVTQQAAAPTCTFSLEPASLSFTPGGGEGRFRVVTQGGCQWSASSGASWAAISSGSGTGPGEVVYAVQANSAASPRSTTIAVGGQTHVVNQEAAAPPPPPACTFAIDSASQNFPAGGGQGRFRVTTQDGCQWSASSGAPWAMVSTSGGTGSGDVLYSVQANTATSPRSTTITVGGQAHTVNQEAAAPPPPPPVCTFALDPGSQNFNASGGQGRFRVTTQDGCQWSASSGASWAVVSATSGTGSGDVSYSVQSNTATSPRSTAITVGGQTHTVNQEAAAPPPPPPPPCTFALEPPSQNFSASGGDGRVRVNTQPGCNWSASSSVPWISVGSGGSGGSSGTGPGDLSYSVQPNASTSPRSGTITVGGQVHTVNQQAPPTTPTSVRRARLF